MEDLTTDLRVRRAFAFVDVCGFTQCADRFGDDAAMQILAKVRAHIRKTCGHYGVRVSKWLGDGAMLVGVDPEPLVSATAAIVAGADTSGPPMRGGLTVGDVLVFEGDDYIGRTVNLAARLCDHAGPGQLLVEASTALPIPPNVQADNRAFLTVRGFQAPIEVVEVQAPVDAGTGTVRQRGTSP